MTRTSWRSGRTWARVAMLFVLTALAGMSFSSAFSTRPLLPLVIGDAAMAVLIPFGVHAFVRRRATLVTIGAAIIGFVVSFSIGTKSVSVAELRVGLVDGWAQLLSSVPPLDVRGPVLAVPILVIWIVGVLGVELAVRNRNAVLVASPALVGMLAGALFGTADPIDTYGLIPIAIAVAAVFGLLVIDAREAATTTPTVRGVGRTVATAVPFVAIAVVAGSILGPRAPGAGDRSPVMLRDHVDERHDVHPLVNPLATLAANERDEANAAKTGKQPQPLFTVEASDAVERYRLAVLDSYDGQQWHATSGFHTAGRNLVATGWPSTASTRTVTQTITLVGDIGGFWVPAAEQPVRVSRPFLFDPSSGTIAFEGPPGGLTYDVVSEIPSFDAAALQSANIVQGADAAPYLEVPGNVSEDLRALAARAMSTSTFQLQQVFDLQEYMKTNYELRPAAQAQPGHSLQQLTTFLTNTQFAQGSPEQLVTALASLTRLAGIPSRVVVGYRGAGRPGSQTVTSADLTLWPEVLFEGLGWVPFDPVPSTEGTAPGAGAAATPSAQAATNEAIAQAATPENADEAAADPNADELDPGSPAGIARSFLIAIVVVLFAVGLAVLWHLRRRRRRRRARRNAATPRQRIIGAWDEALDRLVETGLDRRDADALSAAEVVHRGYRSAGEEAALPLHGLSVLANAAWYDDREPTEAQADKAWQDEMAFEREWAASMTWRQRVERAVLSRARAGPR